MRNLKVVFLFLLVLVVLEGAFAGLPPTTSKVSGDTSNLTTFNYQFPNFTGTHTGITVSLGVNGIAGGGTNNGSLGVTAGGIIYADGTKLMNTGSGVAGQVLTSNGAGVPTWSTGASQWTSTGSDIYYTTGNVGIGTTSPTALLSLKAGTTSVAPIKLTTGSSVTSPVSGAIEYDGSNLYFTDSTPTRQTVATTTGSQVISGKTFSSANNTFNFVPISNCTNCRIEAAILNIANSTSCSVTTQSGTWITSVTAASTVCQITVASNFFLNSPWCVVSNNSTSTLRVFGVVAASATSISVSSFDVGGTPQTGNFYIMCMGNR